MTRHVLRLAHGCLFASLSIATFTPATLLADDDLTAPVRPVVPAQVSPDDEASSPMANEVFDASAFFWHEDPDAGCALPPS